MKTCFVQGARKQHILPHYGGWNGQAGMLVSGVTWCGLYQKHWTTVSEMDLGDPDLCKRCSSNEHVARKERGEEK